MGLTENKMKMKLVKKRKRKKNSVTMNIIRKKSTRHSLFAAKLSLTCIVLALFYTFTGICVASSNHNLASNGQHPQMEEDSRYHQQPPSSGNSQRSVGRQVKSSRQLSRTESDNGEYFPFTSADEWGQEPSYSTEPYQQSRFVRQSAQVAEPRQAPASSKLTSSSKLLRPNHLYQAYYSHASESALSPGRIHLNQERARGRAQSNHPSHSVALLEGASAENIEEQLAHELDEPEAVSLVPNWQQVARRGGPTSARYSLTPSQASLGAIDRFDYNHDDQVHHQQYKEVKEVSYIYPILLALLILGALFVPFISLFFFLAVSAFNCSTGGLGGGLGGLGGLGGGGSFSQVTPIYGRRRRRRRKKRSASGDFKDEEDDDAVDAYNSPSSIAPLLAKAGPALAFVELLLEDFEQYAGGSDGVLASTHAKSLTEPKATNKRRSLESEPVQEEDVDDSAKSDTSDWSLVTSKLPLLMLFDALEFVDDVARPEVGRPHQMNASDHAAPPLLEDAHDNQARLVAGTRSLRESNSIGGTNQLVAAAAAAAATSGLGTSELGTERTKSIQASTGNLTTMPDQAGFARVATVNQNERQSKERQNQQRLTMLPSPVALNDSGNEYRLWQKRLAASTVLLRDALVKFVDI